MSPDRKLQVFTTRLDQSLIREVKIRSAQCEIPVQTIIDQALRLWMRHSAAEH